MFLSTSFALFFLGSFVNAQSSDNAIGIAAIEAHFTGAGLVPSLLTSFKPHCPHDLSPFLASNLTKDQAAPTPEITIVPANSTSVGQTRHWLVNSVTLTGTNSSLNVSTADGVAVTDYAGPAPPEGSGPHRYVILLLPQPSTFSPPANLTQPNVGVSVFHLTDYISVCSLLIYISSPGMYFDVEQGTATATLSPTSPVISSTLKPASSGTSSTSSARPPMPPLQFGAGHSVFAVPAAVCVLFASYMCL
ncbi:hypothetical protein EDB87DRAFT_1629713 [Lactarius vividus]|nr:hypothetical protein EDB87DRAFT_1629713 [Lactarius vividus]